MEFYCRCLTTTVVLLFVCLRLVNDGYTFSKSNVANFKGHNNNQKINGRGRSNDSGLGDDEESPTDNYQQWKKLATIAKGIQVLFTVYE